LVVEYLQSDSQFCFALYYFLARASTEKIYCSIDILGLVKFIDELHDALLFL
jgi:hypothetical protein